MPTPTRRQTVPHRDPTPTAQTADALLTKLSRSGGDSEPASPAMDQVVAFLREALAGGRRPTNELLEQAGTEGISKAALKRARLEAGVAVTRDGRRHGRWVWSLPLPVNASAKRLTAAEWSSLRRGVGSVLRQHYPRRDRLIVVATVRHEPVAPARLHAADDPLLHGGRGGVHLCDGDFDRSAADLLIHVKIPGVIQQITRDKTRGQVILGPQRHGSRVRGILRIPLQVEPIALLYRGFEQPLDPRIEVADAMGKKVSLVATVTDQVGFSEDLDRVGHPPAAAASEDVQVVGGIGIQIQPSDELAKVRPSTIHDPVGE